MNRQRPTKEQAMAAARRRRSAEEARRRQRRKAARKVFLTRVILYFAVLLILSAASVFGFWLHFQHTGTPPQTDAVSYYFGDTGGEPLPDGMSLENGVLYIDFHAVADYLHLIPVGDSSAMRYVVPDGASDSAGTGSEEYVLFRANSTLATVNGQDVRLAGPARLYGNHYLVPVDFLTQYMEGVRVEVTPKAVTLAWLYEDADNTVPQRIAFTLKSPAPMTQIPDTDTSLPTVSPDVPAEFVADLAAYEPYMNPGDRDAYLLLVNGDHLLTESYLPQDLTDLVDTRKDGRNTQKMVKTAAMALEALYIEMRANGITDVSVTSAYRSYSYQAQLFNMYTEQEMSRNPALSRAEAEAITETYSARPGTSEHQTGLCCDMHNLASAQVAFAREDAYKWLKDNAWKFGFILRFPEGKEDITGISFEPWHYRFVGRYHAKAIYEAGLCLEEYLETIP